LSAERATIIAERDQAFKDRDAIKLERDSQVQEIQRLTGIARDMRQLSNWHRQARIERLTGIVGEQAARCC
jgi:hypothetical protein